MKPIKRYDFSKKPQKPSKFWMHLVWPLAITPRLKGRPVTVEKIGMEGVEPPYLLLATHASMLDFPVMFTAVKPHNANNVVAIDAVRDVGDYLMHKLGCITTRKFVKDYHLIRHMKYCADRYGSIVCVYPEARYSFDGTTSYIPPAVAKMAKLMKVPLVVLRMYGTFVAAPQWNKPEQKIPLRAELECIARTDELATVSWQDLYARIYEKMQRDDYLYQRENNIRISNPNRAEGLHSILYQCPHCGTEFGMYSKGTRLWCEACKKAWEMSELSELKAVEGETEFSYIPDWMKWERQNVREEVRTGKYFFRSDVTVHTLPNAKRFYDQGTGTLTQDTEGTTLECIAYGEPTTLHWAGTELESIHIEYDYPFRKKKYWRNVFGDSVDISTNDDSFWLHPVGLRDQITKLSFATEEIYALALERAKGNS